jgi:hypothetical protein
MLPLLLRMAIRRTCGKYGSRIPRKQQTGQQKRNNVNFHGNPLFLL